MSQAADERLRLRDTEIGWPLDEIWVAGELLDEVEALESGCVVLSLDLTPDELPWRVDHPTAAWIGSDLRLGKRPFSWCYRPSVWPAWNAANGRVLRIWSETGGADGDAIELLAQRLVGDVAIVQPTDTDLTEELELELAVSRVHLGSVLDGYWDIEWRRDHKWGDGPEDHLWRAAQGVREIEEALTAIA
jgi:hypothetical protein